MQQELGNLCPNILKDSIRVSFSDSAICDGCGHFGPKPWPEARPTVTCNVHLAAREQMMNEAPCISDKAWRC